MIFSTAMKRLFALVLSILGLLTVAKAQESKSIAERLGYPRDAKLLIVHADDLGMAHSVNAATIKALETGLVNSGSIMVPCPWLSEIAAYARANPQADLGLHLTLTSEWTSFRWGPVSSRDRVSSLLDKDGYFYLTESDAAAHADPKQVEMEITAQIEKSGFVLKRGTLIDASLIRSAVNPPEPPDTPLPLDTDGRPASKLVKSAHDPDAAWTKKDGKYAFGYKMHVAMDQGSRIIRRLAFTPANVNDTVPADGLICGDEATVYADKAYDSRARRLRLKEMGIRDGIMRRHNRWLRLGAWAVRRNAVISHRRAPIEPLFALLKRVYGFARARYRGLMRNAAAFQLAATAINLQRWARTTPHAA